MAGVTYIDDQINETTESVSVVSVFTQLVERVQTQTVTVEKVVIDVEVRPPAVYFIDVTGSGAPGQDGADGSGGIAQQYITLTQGQIDAAELELDSAPPDPTKVAVTARFGTHQFPNVDFVVQGKTLSWFGLAMQLLLEPGDTLLISYAL